MERRDVEREQGEYEQKLQADGVSAFESSDLARLELLAAERERRLPEIIQHNVFWGILKSQAALAALALVVWFFYYGLTYGSY